MISILVSHAWTGTPHLYSVESHDPDGGILQYETRRRRRQHMPWQSFFTKPTKSRDHVVALENYFKRTSLWARLSIYDP